MPKNVEGRKTAVLDEPAVADAPAAPDSAAAAEPKPPKELKGLGAIIRKFRLLRNLTQMQVANAMGHRTPEWCGMLEAGLRPLDLEKAPQLADVLQVDRKDLTKHTLFEYFPKAAEALFGDELPVANIREEFSPKPTRLQPETLEFARLYESLPRPLQESLVHLAMNMRDVFSRGVRDTSRAIPVNRGKY